MFTHKLEASQKVTTIGKRGEKKTRFSIISSHEVLRSVGFDEIIEIISGDNKKISMKMKLVGVVVISNCRGFPDSFRGSAYRDIKIESQKTISKLDASH